MSTLSTVVSDIQQLLSITKTIVDARGGRIAASSELGVGTTFEVRLPLAPSRVVLAV
jgi:signal transduction histidine kinase